MTELEKIVDNEIGNDTEHSRLTLIKYVNYGRRLAEEAMAASQPIYTVKQLADILKSELSAQATDILNEVDAVLKAAGEAQAEVERVDEDEAFEKIKLTPQVEGDNFGPWVLREVEALLTTVDAKHTEINKTIREPGLAAVRAKYVKA